MNALKSAARFGSCVMLVLALLGLVTELCLRTLVIQPFPLGYLHTHPKRHYALVPDYRGTTYDQPLNINSFGMRDSEVSIRPEAQRVAVFGDSLSFGQGVSIEDTWEKQLGNLLGAGTQVLNFSVPGYNTESEASQLEEVSSWANPQLVIFQFTMDDDCAFSPASSGNQHPLIRATKDLLRGTYAYSYFAGRYYGLKTRPNESDPGYHYFEGDPGWRQCQDAFARIAAIARARDERVIFALFGYPSAALGDASVAKAAMDLSLALDRAGLTEHVLVDDALVAYRGRETELRVRPDDHHLNSRAHRLVADYLARYLAEHPRNPAHVAHD